MSKDRSPNKAKMFFDLNEWISIGNGVDFMIVDSTFQHPDYAPYVVAEFLKKTPPRNIPGAVLEALRTELIEMGQEPKPQRKSWLKRLLSF